VDCIEDVLDESHGFLKIESRRKIGTKKSKNEKLLSKLIREVRTLYN